MRRILVGVDGSEASYKALQLAAQVALRFGARLTLAHVVQRLLLPPDVYGLTAAEVEENHRAFGEKLLADASARLGEPGLTVDTVLLEGSPAESLAEAAQAPDVDLVVAGRRGRGAVARMLLGSVSDRLAHICPKSVLIAH